MKINEFILPKSPYVLDGTQKLKESVDITLDLSLFPQPETRDLIWVIKDSTTGDQLEIEPNIENGRYSSKFENVGDNKYQAVLTIDPLQEEDILKEIYFLIKADDDDRR